MANSLTAPVAPNISLAFIGKVASGTATVLEVESLVGATTAGQLAVAAASSPLLIGTTVATIGSAKVTASALTSGATTGNLTLSAAQTGGVASQEWRVEVPQPLTFIGKVPSAGLLSIEVTALGVGTSAALLTAAAAASGALIGTTVAAKATSKVTASTVASPGGSTGTLTLSTTQTAEVASQEWGLAMPTSFFQLGIFQAPKGTIVATAGEWSTFSISAGKLPAGLTLEEGPGFTAIIGGTPTAVEEQTGIKILATSVETPANTATNATAFKIQVTNSEFTYTKAQVAATVVATDNNLGKIVEKTTKPGEIITSGSQEDITALAQLVKAGSLARTA